ncbi:hypothetical protein AU476_14305 [Cupriavidus sp. UYMSc13B]|nr:hypothetical protein AU476_14305 [Cupriavidus sp. UYMSc13B]
MPQQVYGARTERLDEGREIGSVLYESGIIPFAIPWFRVGVPEADRNCSVMIRELGYEWFPIAIITEGSMHKNQGYALSLLRIGHFVAIDP